MRAVTGAGWHAVVRVAAVLVLAGTLAGCRGGEPRATPSAPVSVSPSVSPTPSPSPTPEPVAVEAAYRAYWKAVLAAGCAANAAEPSLRQWAVGKALTAVQDRMRRLAKAGQTLCGPVRLHPTVVLPVQGPRATVRDCLDASGLFIHDRTGRRIGKGGSSHSLAIATLVKDGRTWKVSEASVKPSAC